MAQTYHQLYIQSVFPVKNKQALIHPHWKPELLAVMGQLINETGCNTIIVNGAEDHMHCFFRLKPSISVSAVMKSVKAKSSKWINESGYLSQRFEWQSGYACFSYSFSHVKAVVRYLQNQENYHLKTSFQAEYTHMLRKYELSHERPYPSGTLHQSVD